ncbi:PHB depolymerase family esterase [Mesorhizobium sp.]|uniref:extracellular catalytic domain type 1 short-chain-length polyhydroxyalkanoate depolymerase n=2 Tax=Mesorhizobium sp. TaxID=1871066 RepID=UPI000FE75377|nr:PHB depolymerase family esterase [Mesorhizobium sp.]RWK42146.1 MAG: PHB depolymerase family esterase [Mesorhizobium sp.]RWK70086.1 MAG: PHB depolymerase family esterase [Mesorhizobium sp.]RWK80029.1 MAG: PHB depolymerase family esterase [Mesorhizobium sp.]RWL07714.1 MAG: PHB depolymerase family esterase [Mesorhizobium sp.]RWL14649.1 MAG: PHB depolymerase family esterase [Mesorhizobium sp.]
MRKISDTITRLAAFRAGQGFQTNGQGRDRLSDLDDFGSNPGALRARIHVPDDLTEAAPLVVVLHGCTQTAAGYDHGSGWAQLADQERFVLLFPEQQRANNANLCFNWFVPSDTKRNGGEALSIRQMIETMVLAHGLDRGRIFITGLSAGGAMASAMLACYPEIFAGGAIIAGLPYGSAKTVPEAFDRMRGHGMPSERQLQKALRDATPHQGPWPSISVWHGSADQTVVSSNADAIIGQWRAVHGLDACSTRSEMVDGHSRRVWCNAQGQELIEEYRIAGMGHGTPLGTAGDAALGVGGPFMLDVGISSTWHIARFWGIAKPCVKRDAKIKPAKANNEALAPGFARAFSMPKAGVPNVPHSAKRANIPPSQKPNSAAEIRKVIEDALRSAGLMH